MIRSLLSSEPRVGVAPLQIGIPPLLRLASMGGPAVASMEASRVQRAAAPDLAIGMADDAGLGLTALRLHLGFTTKAVGAAVTMVLGPMTSHVPGSLRSPEARAPAV